MLHAAESAKRADVLKEWMEKKYIRYLLEREERGNLPRFAEYFAKTAKPAMDVLQIRSSVTEDERRTIEQEQLGSSPGPAFTGSPIKNFPTPMGVIDECIDANQRQMLMRLYPEYQFLCSFAHGDSESIVFRAAADPRSPLQRVVPMTQIKDFYQRQVLQTPIIYSAIASVQTATEIAALYPSQIELMAEVAEAWTALNRFSLLATPVWEVRAKKILTAI